jgi:hypothetical protein
MARIHKYYGHVKRLLMKRLLVGSVSFIVMENEVMALNQKRNTTYEL